MARPFAVAGFSMLLTLTALFFLPEWAVFVALALCAAGFAAALLLRKQNGSSAWPATLGSSMLACVLLLIQLGTVYYPAMAQTGDDLDIRAQITSNAEHRYGRYYYTARTISINGEDARVRLRLSSPYPIYAEPYDEISYHGTIFALGDEDPAQSAHYKARGLYLGSYAQSYGEDRFSVTPGTRFHLMKPILHLQSAIRQKLLERYSDETSALLDGMLLGNAGGLSWLTQEEFRQTGISHLFSVSGLHVSLLSWSLYRALRKIKRREKQDDAQSDEQSGEQYRKPLIPEKVVVAICCVFILLFMALTGFVGPCVRSGITMLVLLCGKLFHRRADSLNSLGFAALLMMLISPLSAGQIGLLLSFGATFGIVTLEPHLSRPGKQFARRFGSDSLMRRGVLAINGGLCLTASALALTIPIQLLRLPSGISMLTFLSNLVFVPLSNFLIPLSGLSVLFRPLTWLVAPLANLMLTGVHLLGRVPAPVLRNTGTAAIPLGICAAIAGTALLLHYLGKPVRLRLIAGIICVVLLLGTWLPGFLRRNDTVVQQLDTGEGTAVLIHKGNRAALLGCGGDTLPAGAAKQALSALGILELQVLLVPGADKSLSAGAAELQKDVPIKQVLHYDGFEAGSTIPFTLWEGAGGIFIYEKGRTACLLHLEQAYYVLPFEGELPADWQNIPLLEGGRILGVHQ